MNSLLQVIFVLLLVSQVIFPQRRVSSEAKEIGTKQIIGKVQLIDTLFYSDGDGVTFITNNNGYIAGTNEFDDKGKYQRIDISGSNLIKGVFIAFSEVEIRPAGSPDTVNLVVRTKASDGSPGSLIYSGILSTADFDVSSWNFFELNPHVPYNDTFFVGIEWTGIWADAEADRFGLLTDANGLGDGRKRAWEQWSDNSYNSIHDAWNNGAMDIDLWIGVVVDDDYVVPVELASFAGSYNNNEVNLTWNTITETNNLGFEIQRSSSHAENSDMKWQSVGFVYSSSNSTTPRSYTFADNNPVISGFYRLKILDLDGSFEYSKTIKMSSTLEYSLFQNYPNPFNPATVIKYSVPTESMVHIIVINMLGETVSELVNSVHNAGVHEIVFDARNLPSGLYFYKISIVSGDNSRKFTEAKKMLVVK